MFKICLLQKIVLYLQRTFSTLENKKGFNNKNTKNTKTVFGEIS